MRILAVTIGCLFVCFMGFIVIKQWGRSQVYIEYRHPMLRTEPGEASPRLFIKPAPGQLRDTLKTRENLYLELAMTADEILVVRDQKPERPIRMQKFEAVKNQVVPLKEVVGGPDDNRKYIFNFVENAIASHLVFHDTLKELGLEKGQNFILMSDYEAPPKAIKELMPALIYGTSKPEILKIVAMDSMYLIEAMSLRADVVVHPLHIRKQPFYTPSLLAELDRRYKKIIVGPITGEELEEAEKIKPIGIILSATPAK